MLWLNCAMDLVISEAGAESVSLSFGGNVEDSSKASKDGVNNKSREDDAALTGYSIALHGLGDKAA